jgi:hypothetical protein
MQYRLKEPVCPCGANDLQQGHQVQDHAGRWTTLAERLADPSIQVNATQRLAWVADPTDFTCCACHQRIDPAFAQALIDKAFGGKSLAELPVIETIGVGIINPRGLYRLRVDG